MSEQPEVQHHAGDEFERELLPLCKDQGIAVIPYSPLAAGFLTGKYRTAEDLAKSPRGMGAPRKHLENNSGVLAKMDRVTRNKRHMRKFLDCNRFLLRRPCAVLQK